jgi:hypothetical protein
MAPTRRLLIAWRGISEFNTASQFVRVGLKAKLNGWLIADVSLKDAKIVQKYGKKTINNAKINIMSVMIL